MEIRNAASTARNEVAPGQRVELPKSYVAAERKRSKVIDHWFECGDLVDSTGELEAAAKAKAEALLEAAAKAKAEALAETEAAKRADLELDAGLIELAGEKLAQVLTDADYQDVGDVAKAETDDLMKLQGIGAATADDLIERALEAETSGDEE